MSSRYVVDIIAYKSGMRSACSSTHTTDPKDVRPDPGQKNVEWWWHSEIRFSFPLQEIPDMRG